MRDVGHPVGICELHHEHADPVGARRGFQLQVFIQVVEMEIHLARDRGAVAPVINGPDVEFPVARINGASDGQPVADLESVQVGQLAAHDAALAVAQEVAELAGLEHELRVDREEVAGVDRELRKKRLFVAPDAAEPLGRSHSPHPFDRADPVAVVQRQGKRQRNRAARDHAGRRRHLHAGVPCTHHRLQQPERHQRDHQAQQRQNAAQPGAKSVAQRKSEEEHGSVSSERRRIGELSLVQVDQVVGRLGRAWVMRDHRDRLAQFEVQAVQQLQDFGSREAVQVAGGLVGDDQQESSFG